jgi:hypothetical protein
MPKELWKYGLNEWGQNAATPDGTRVMRTAADYRQLNDALFHAGLNSGSSCEYDDENNRLHFYTIDVARDSSGILSYTIGVTSSDNTNSRERGVVPSLLSFTRYPFIFLYRQCPLLSALWQYNPAQKTILLFLPHKL